MLFSSNFIKDISGS